MNKHNGISIAAVMMAIGFPAWFWFWLTAQKYFLVYIYAVLIYAAILLAAIIYVASENDG